MAKIEKLEKVVTALSREEYSQFRQWFLEHDWGKRGRKIEANSENGSLGFLF